MTIYAGQSINGPTSKGKRPRTIGKGRKGQGSKAKRWTLTLNNYSDADIKQMEKRVPGKRLLY